MDKIEFYNRNRNHQIDLVRTASIYYSFDAMDLAQKIFHSKVV